MDLSLLEQLESKTAIYNQAVLGRIYEMSVSSVIEQLRSVGKLDYYSDTLEKIYNVPIARKAYVTGGDEHWKLVNFVEMKYNRMVFFPSFVFHAQHYQDNWFGNLPETQRFAQEFVYPWMPR
ncbi:MAG: hypothetical protein ACI9N9_001370 [Enterobacterales bacterium]